MELKPGYKLTEVGVIPEDWDMVNIGDHFKFKNGLNKAKKYFGFGTPIVNYMDVFQYPSLRLASIKGCVDVNTRELNAYEVRQGDVFFTRTSETIEEIGVASVMIDEPKDMVFSGFILRARPIDQVFDNNYKVYCFASAYFRKQVTARASYTTRALTNGRSLSIAFIAKPPLAEQCAIAAALSDVDALLDVLDRLITKKRNIKQAAMQQLLTSKTRLPGFEGEWEVKRLGDVAEIIMGQSPSSSNYNLRGYGVPLIQGNADIVDRKTIKRVFTTQITKMGKKGDILMSVRAPVGEISKTLFDVCLGRGVCVLRFSNDFLYHYMIFFEPAWAKLSKGSTFNAVNSTDVKAAEIELPLSIKEQTAIAQVLSDMDAEITALEKRRKKTQDIKQAMMQELLTGKTRLVKRGEENG